MIYTCSFNRTLQKHCIRSCFMNIIHIIAQSCCMCSSSNLSLTSGNTSTFTSSFKLVTSLLVVNKRMFTFSIYELRFLPLHALCNHGESFTTIKSSHDYSHNIRNYDYNNGLSLESFYCITI